MGPNSDKPSGVCKQPCWVLYCRKIGQTHKRKMGIYFREKDALADRDLYNVMSERFVWTVEADQWDYKEKRLTNG